MNLGRKTTVIFEVKNINNINEDVLLIGSSISVCWKGKDTNSQTSFQSAYCLLPAGLEMLKNSEKSYNASC